MTEIRVTVDLVLQVPNSDYANQIQIAQELINKLYVGVEHYADDVFSVSNLHITSFNVQS